MNELAITGQTLPPITEEALQVVLGAEQRIGESKQIEVVTEHVIHAGMYSRTVRLAPFVVIVGALIKIPTMLIVHGDTAVFAGDKWYSVNDYEVIPAQAGRKQIFVTRGNTEITMMFPTKAKTVEEAERQFTDETEKLMSRKNGDSDVVVITECEPCQE